MRANSWAAKARGFSFAEADLRNYLIPNHFHPSLFSKL
jgi:hypothetical protein